MSWMNPFDSFYKFHFNIILLYTSRCSKRTYSSFSDWNAVCTLIVAHSCCTLAHLMLLDMIIWWRVQIMAPQYAVFSIFPFFPSVLFKCSLLYHVFRHPQSIKIVRFWDMTPCSVVGRYRLISLTSSSVHFYPVDGDTRFLRNVGTKLRKSFNGKRVSASDQAETRLIVNL